MLKLNTELDSINRRLADTMLPAFGADVLPYQTDDGHLIFRGPLPQPDDPGHVGAHFAVHLTRAVRAALEAAQPEQREVMITNLVRSLAAQVRTQYAPAKVDVYAMEFVGTVNIL